MIFEEENDGTRREREAVALTFDYGCYGLRFCEDVECVLGRFARFHREVYADEPVRSRRTEDHKSFEQNSQRVGRM